MKSVKFTYCGNFRAYSSSIVRACDTHVSHQSRTDDMDLAKIPRPTRRVLVTKLLLESTLLQRHGKIF